MNNYCRDCNGQTKVMATQTVHEETLGTLENTTSNTCGRRSWWSWRLFHRSRMWRVVLPSIAVFSPDSQQLTTSQEEMLSPCEKVGYKADFNGRGPNHLTSFIARARRGLLGFNYFLQNSDDFCRLPLDMRSDVGLDVVDFQIDSDRGTASNRVLRRLCHVRVCRRKKSELARKRQEKI